MRLRNMDVLSSREYTEKSMHVLRIMACLKNFTYLNIFCKKMIIFVYVTIFFM